MLSPFESSSVAMTRADVYEFFDFSIRYLCRLVGAPEVGVIDHEELLGGVERRNHELYDYAVDFYIAYREWFNFTDELISASRAAVDSAEDCARLNQLVARRDFTRLRLRDFVATLPAPRV